MPGSAFQTISANVSRWFLSIPESNIKAFYSHPVEIVIFLMSVYDTPASQLVHETILKDAYFLYVGKIPRSPTDKETCIEQQATTKMILETHEVFYH